MNHSLESFVQHISEDDLTDDMKLIAESCGIDVARNLMLRLPGLRFYVPAPQRMTEVIFRFIMADRKTRKMPYTEADQKRIALALNISVAHAANVARRVEQVHQDQLGVGKNILTA